MKRVKTMNAHGVFGHRDMADDQVEAYQAQLVQDNPAGFTERTEPDGSWTPAEEQTERDRPLIVIPAEYWFEVDDLDNNYDFQLLQTYRRRTGPDGYPPLGDQLDALWKGGTAADEMRQRIQDVKATYPKPERNE